jgi:hypothetical protein
MSKKITELPEALFADFSGDWLFEVVTNPDTTPESKKLAWGELAQSFQEGLPFLSLNGGDVGGNVNIGGESVIHLGVDGNSFFSGDLSVSDFLRVDPVGKALHLYNFLNPGDPGDFESVRIQWDLDVLRISPQWGTTGVARPIVFSAGATEVLRIQDSGGVSFFGASPPGQQTSADLTNDVTSGGTDDTIEDFSDLTVFANSAATIRNDIYQLARKLKQLNDGLRAYGLFT